MLRVKFLIFVFLLNFNDFDVDKSCEEINNLMVFKLKWIFFFSVF